MDKYFKKFLQKSNLEKILELFLIEDKTLSNINEPSAFNPSPIIDSKDKLTDLLNIIKPPFYSITNIKPVKDPKLYSLDKNVLKQYLKFYVHNNNLTITITGSALIAILFHATYSMFPVTLGSFFLTNSLLAGFDYLLMRNKLKNCKGLHFKNKIFLTALNKVESSFCLAHEYSHYVRFKKKTLTNNKFVEEGIAQAMASKTLKNLSGLDFLLYASIFNIGSYLLSYKYLSEYHNTPMHPLISVYYNALIRNEHHVNDKLIHSKNKFFNTLKNYSFSTSAVKLTELKFGEKVYQELFNGNTNLLLDY